MLSQKVLYEHLYYDPKTGFLWWRAIGRGRPMDRPAGSKHIYGYIEIKFRKKLYKAHRLAWLLMTGKWPKLDVEHRDRNKGNNRWTNLRLANDSQNQANAGVRIDNSSGFKGVWYRKDTKKWRSKIQVRKRRIEIGSFDTPEQAHAAYMKAAKKYFGEFARAR